MEMALGALIGLNAASLPFLPSSKIYLKRHLDGKNYFSVEKVQVIAEGELVNRFANGTIRVFITITYSRSLAFKVGELKHFLTHTIKTYTGGSK
jgi:hypothetical protein